MASGSLALSRVKKRTRMLRALVACERKKMEDERRGRCRAPAFHGGSRPTLCRSFAGYGTDGTRCWIHAQPAEAEE